MAKSFNEKKLSYLLSHIKLYLHLREKTKGFFNVWVSGVWTRIIDLFYRKIRPIKTIDESTCSLPEGLATDAVRDPDCT